MAMFSYLVFLLDLNETYCYYICPSSCVSWEFLSCGNFHVDGIKSICKLRYYFWKTFVLNFQWI